MHRALLGGFVQRVLIGVIGRRDVGLLRVRQPGESVHVVLAGGMGLGVVDDDGRARLREAMQGSHSPQQARYRARLDGGRVVAVSEHTLTVEREGKRWRARSESGGGVTLEEVEAGSEDASTPDADFEAKGAAIVEALGGAVAMSRREALARALAKAAARAKRRAAAVRGDLAKMADAEENAQRAQMFVGEAARAPRGARELVTVDWSSGEAQEARLALDPARGAREQIEAIFKRARRMKEGAKIAQGRLADAEQAAAALGNLAAGLANADDDDLDAIERRARAAAPRDFKAAPANAAAGRRASKDTPHPPFRTFRSTSDERILVGRGAEKNDALTFHVGRPHDLWLHAKNRTGAHVIVPLDKNASCPADLLVDAAHLAAHFSEARDEAVVEIQYTPRRYLRKPRGSAPGLVVVDREKVLVLRREENRLRALLEREVDA